MVRRLTLCGLLLVSHVLPPVPSPGERGIGRTPVGVLMGMRIENVAQTGQGTRVVTTGAEFVLERTGPIRCFQRIPERREVAQIEIPRESAPLKLESQTDFACLFSPGGSR